MRPTAARASGRRRLTSAAAHLGTRPVGRLLWHNCVQTTLAVGVFGIYALTNIWFVGRGAGPQAMAAVSLATPVLLVLGAVATTVGAGGASLVSRCLGADDPAGAAQAAGNAFVLFWITAAGLGVTGLLALEPLLTLLGTRGGIRDDARAYLLVLLSGALLATGFSGLVRAEGRIRYATLIWVAAVLVQIALDPILILGLGLGVVGAALGTLGGHSVSVAMSLWFFFGRCDRAYRISRRDLVPHGPTLRALVGLGAPSFLTGVGATLLSLLVNTELAHTDRVSSGAPGPVALTAYAVCSRLQTFVMMPHLGISQGLQPIVGYNAGQGRDDRVRRARVLALRACLLYGFTAALVLICFAQPLVQVFLPDPAVAGAAIPALRIIALGLAVAGVPPLVSAYFQSIGQAGPSYLVSAGTLLLVKVPLVLVAGWFGKVGVWIALAVGEGLSALLAGLLLRYRSGPGNSRDVP